MVRASMNALRNVSIGSVVLAVSWGPIASADAAISVVALESDVAPGTAGGIIRSFPDFNATLNNAGQVAYAVDLAIGTGDVTAGSSRALYRHTFGAASELVARGQAEIPALPGSSYDSSSPRYAGPGSMNDAGEIVFSASFGLGQSAFLLNGTSIVRGAPTAAPGLPAGVNIATINSGSLNDARINNAGQALYTVGLSGVGVGLNSNTALYRGNTPVAREGDVAPGTSDAFGQFTNVQNARINASGQVAFTHDLATSGPASNGVIYRETPGSGLALLARDAGPAPGTAGEFFSGAGFHSLRINTAGQVAYLGELAGGANVLYVDSALHARDGAAAPGLPGLTLRNVGGAAVGGTVELNDAGTLLFVANVEGPGVTPGNNSVIYLDTKPMARTAAPAPISGATFASFAGGDLALNNRNQFAVVAELAGPGITAQNDRALLMWDGGSWHVVAREGGSLAGGSIARLVAGNGNPRIELNDRSQVLFWANLTDGRDGLFLTSPIPEPALVWTFLAGVALIGMRVARGHGAAAA